jgi:hypothetical protein
MSRCPRNKTVNRKRHARNVARGDGRAGTNGGSTARSAVISSAVRISTRGGRHHQSLVEKNAPANSGPYVARSLAFDCACMATWRRVWWPCLSVRSGRGRKVGKEIEGHANIVLSVCSCMSPSKTKVFFCEGSKTKVSFTLAVV